MPFKCVYPFEMLRPKGTANLPKDSKVKANQIRTLDRIRIVKLIGALPKDVMDGIEKAMMLHVGLE